MCWIFFQNNPYWNLPYWATRELVAVIIAVIVFGAVVAFIMGPSEKDNWHDLFDDDGKFKSGKSWKNAKMLDVISDIFERK